MSSGDWMEPEGWSDRYESVSDEAHAGEVIRTDAHAELDAGDATGAQDTPNGREASFAIEAMGASDPFEFAGLTESLEAAGGDRHVRARILWPALGFPAVIAPRASATGTPMREGDATRCVTVLLVSDRKFLSKEEAARFLRFVPWSQRGRRQLAAGIAGAFAEVDLAVRNDASEPALTMPQSRDRFGEMIAFGGNADGENGVVVTLANRVRDFYRSQGLAWLHEIRISEQASARLADGHYHLFWNNRLPAEDAASDEMALLVDAFARPRRTKLGDLWTRFGQYLLDEYAYEYRPLHPRTGTPVRGRRSEVLHPLFVDRRAAGTLRVGHITDTHVCVRADIYGHNLAAAGVRAVYNNWNTSFMKAYDGAKQDSDAILLTGDLIDYGRGHWGYTAARKLASDGLYQEDRNWFLFHDLLASGDAYRVPVYTILGNHDWRINPYPPFAIAGAPDPKLLIHDHARYPTQEQRRILETAHGEGAGRKFSYQVKAESKAQLLVEQTGSALKALGKLLLQTRTMDEPGSPTETTVESVAWYLLVINPFFDYTFVLPGRHRVLMLDWAEDEDVLFPIIAQGKEWPYLLWQVGEAAAPGPKAKRCLTPLQRRMVTTFVEAPGRAKVIGIHAPPIAPYPDWRDPDLYIGRKVYKRKRDARGPTNFATKMPDGTVVPWNGHPIFAIRPKSGDLGMEADYGSFVQGREWFIRTVADPRRGVRAVLSGHNHRNGLYVVHVPDRSRGALLAGEWLVRQVADAAVRGAQPPAVSRTPEGTRGPLYISTTSGGPRGNAMYREPTDAERRTAGLSVDPGYAHIEIAADGTIVRVDFRSALVAVAPTTGTPSPTPAGTVPTGGAPAVVGASTGGATTGSAPRESADAGEYAFAESAGTQPSGDAFYEYLFGPESGDGADAGLPSEIAESYTSFDPFAAAPASSMAEQFVSPDAELPGEAQFAEADESFEGSLAARPDWMAYL